MTQFEQYIAQCTEQVRKIRAQQFQGEKLEMVVRMNTPFELKPKQEPINKIYKKGILLTHGFLTTPYIMRSLAEDFSNDDFLVRAVLLPGHGTQFQDLDQHTWQDALNIVRFGYQTLCEDCEEVYLCGFSLGATLSLLLSLELTKKNNHKLKKLILIAPCLGINPVATSFPFLVKTKLAKFLPHLFCTQAEKEHLASYKQFSMYSVSQITLLLKHLHQQLKTEKLNTPTYICASTEDATVKFKAILNFVNTYLNTSSHIRIYTNKNFKEKINIPNTIINIKGMHTNINAFSHVALPVASKDLYFGINGSYYGKLATNIHFGEPDLFTKLKGMKRLTYNPDYQNFQHELFKWLE